MNRLDNLDTIIRYLMADLCVSHQISSTLEGRQRLMRALMNIWQPKAISHDFLAAQDAELRMQCEEKGVVEPHDEGLSIWQGDITRLKVDAIVNAANAQALGCWQPLHNCIDNCIHSAAGIQLRKECHDLMQGRLLLTGDAIITKGYNLPAKHVIHTVGPIIHSGMPTPEQEEQLSHCYTSCLDLAEQNGLVSIAFCCISTGVFHFPSQRAAEIAVEAVNNYNKHSLKTIIFNVFLDKDRDIYKQLLQPAC
ncbi:MAG: protein-ADP-ribose hydrolase [Bacteroidales bacterium]|nr:protein-ADP-ribose hydrolase [Bacteroidales bacterium]